MSPFRDGLVGGVGEIRSSGQEAYQDASGGELRGSAVQELPEVDLTLVRERLGYGGLAAHDPAGAAVVQLRRRVCHYRWHLRIISTLTIAHVVRQYTDRLHEAY